MPDTRVEDEILGAILDGTEILYMVQGGVPRRLTPAMINDFIVRQIGAFTPAGRLTLSTGVAVTSADIGAATTIYLTPVGGQYVPYFTGTSWGRKDVSTDLILPLDSSSGHTNYHQANKNFDVWLAYVAGTIFIGTGPKWNDGAVGGSDILRGEGANSSEISSINGIVTNKVSMQLRFGTGISDLITVPPGQATLLGSFRTTADGQTEDSATKRFLSNLYNVDYRPLVITDTTDNWGYITASWRQKRNSTANQVEWLHTIAGRTTSLSELGYVTNIGTAAHSMAVGIGIDSVVANSAQIVIPGTANSSLSTGPAVTVAQYNGFAGIGYHKACELEWGGGSDTQLWFGDGGVGAAGSGTGAAEQTGMHGRTPN